MDASSGDGGSCHGHEYKKITLRGHVPLKVTFNVERFYLGVE